MTHLGLARLHHLRNQRPSWFRAREIVEDLDQAKAFAHEPHVFAEPSQPTEISPVRITPILQTPVALALVARKRDIDLVEAPIGHLSGLDHAAWLATAIEHDPALAGWRGVRLVFCAAGRGLNTHDDERDEFHRQAWDYHRKRMCEGARTAQGWA